MGWALGKPLRRRRSGWTGRTGWTGWTAWPASLLCLAAIGPVAQAEEAAGQGEAPPEAAVPVPAPGEAPPEAAVPVPAPGEGNPEAVEPAPVGLDALLRLPDPVTTSPSVRRGGADRERWEERFRGARSDLTSAREQLVDAQDQLEKLAARSENWQVAAPGAQPGGENSPLSYRLRQEIRGHREEVSRQERRLRELEVEASLAGVPTEWRNPVHEDAVPGS